jgi:uncharacterized protein (DUF58 family)
MSGRPVRLRPAGAPRRGLALLGLVAALFFVARASGAGWVVVLLCLEAGLVVVAAVWPVVTLLRVGVAVTGSPLDATAGSTAVFSVRVRRAGAGVRVRLAVGGQAGGWVAALGAGHGPVRVVPPRRGVVTAVVAEVEGAGPLGLVPWLRRLPITLATPMEVAPAPKDVSLDDLPDPGAGHGDLSVPAGAGHDTVRGVRAYLPGDPIRIVHWQATARWGDVMVKELEDPFAAEIVVVVDLRGEPDRSEQAASLAAGVAGAALRTGFRVSLLTAERRGPCAGPVGSPLEAGRRLARAVTDAAPPEPRPGDATVIRVTAA